MSVFGSEAARISLADRMHLALPEEHMAGRVGNWFVTLRSPLDLLKDEPTFLGCELVFYSMALLCLVHACREKARYRWLWITTICHGLMTECVSYW